MPAPPARHSESRLGVPTANERPGHDTVALRQAYRRRAAPSPRLRVGLAVSLSGPLAPMGIDAQRGFVLWAADARAAGRPVELIIRDDRSNPRLACQHVRDLLDREGIDLLAGPYSSGLTRAVAPIAEARGVVLWNHGGAADDLHRRGYRTLVSILTPASRYLVPALRWVPQGPVLILRRRASGFAAAVAAGAEAEARRLGRAVSLVPYPGTPAAIEAQVKRISTTPPALLLAAGRLTDDIALAQALRRRGLAPRSVLVATPVRAFRLALGPAADGFTGPSQWVVTAKAAPDFGPTSRVFARRFRARFGVAPDYPAAQAYATGLVMTRCVERVGCADQELLRAVAAALDCTTFFGRFSIDRDTGMQMAHDVHLVQWVRATQRVIPL